MGSVQTDFIAALLSRDINSWTNLTTNHKTWNECRDHVVTLVCCQQRDVQVDLLFNQTFVSHLPLEINFPFLLRNLFNRQSQQQESFENRPNEVCCQLVPVHKPRVLPKGYVWNRRRRLRRIKTSSISKQFVLQQCQRKNKSRDILSNVSVPRICWSSKLLNQSHNDCQNTVLSNNTAPPYLWLDCETRAEFSRSFSTLSAWHDGKKLLVAETFNNKMFRHQTVSSSQDVFCFSAFLAVRYRSLGRSKAQSAD